MAPLRGSPPFEFARSRPPQKTRRWGTEPGYTFESMKSAIRFAMLALVLVIVAMVSALTAMRFAIHGQEVAVPALVGLTPLEAEREAAGLGLQISVETQYY